MRFGRAFLTLLGGNTLNMALNFAGRVVLARLLGPASMGVFGVSLNIMTVLSRWLSLGVASATQHHASKDDVTAPTTLRTSLTLALLIGIAMTGLTWLARPWLQTLLFPDEPAAYATFSLFVPGLGVIMVGMVLGVFVLARDQVGHYNLVQIGSTALFVAALAAGMWLEPLRVAAYAMHLNWLSAALLALFFLRPYWHGGRWDSQLARAMMSFALRAWPLIFFQFGTARLAIILGARLVTAEDMGQYVVAANVAESLLIVQAALGQLLFNRVSQRGEQADQLMMRVTRLTTGMLVGIAGVAVLIGEPLYVFFFGATYRPGWGLCLILLATAVLHSLLRLQLNYLSGRGQPGRGSLAQAAELCALLISVPLLTNLWGISGLALATVISATLSFGSVTAMVQHVLKRGAIESFLPQLDDARLVMGTGRDIAHQLRARLQQRSSTKSE